MSNALTLTPALRARGTLALPGSKSLSNRALLLAALAQGTTRLTGLLDAQDTQVMITALRALGVPLMARDTTQELIGTGGEFAVKAASLDLGNAGTALRPLTAVLALQNGTYTIRGTARMHERPIADLVAGLRGIGANITYLGQEGYPPLHLAPARVQLSEPVRVRGNVSSQFLSSLLMALPTLRQPSRIEVTTPLISQPYVALTLALMARFGVQVQQHNWQRFDLPAGPYLSPGALTVEGDASGASYLLAAGVLGGGPVRVTGVGKNSVQGDIAFAEVLARMGGQISWGEEWIEASADQRHPLRALEIDCTTIPDAAMTLAICALKASGTTTLRGIASWRVKETDRIAAMACELRKLGAQVQEGADFIAITRPAQFAESAIIDTYDDHRMAMCFSLACLLGVRITINDPACVRKTYPGYWQDFSLLL